MYEKLDELLKLNEKMDSVLTEVKACNKALFNDYKERENEVLNHFFLEMDKLAFYGSQYPVFRNNRIEKGLDMRVEGLDIDTYHYHRSGDGIFDLRFDTDANYEFRRVHVPYGHEAVIYSSKNDEWRWEPEACKKYFALHANEIISIVQDTLEKHFTSMIENKAAAVSKQQTKLLSEIGAADVQIDALKAKHNSFDTLENIIKDAQDRIDKKGICDNTKNKTMER